MDSPSIKKISISRSLLLTLLLVTFAMGVFIGAGSGFFSPLPAARSDNPIDDSEGTFRFIRTSAEMKGPKSKASNTELKPFQYKVNALIEGQLRDGNAATISIYFRDLNNGNWFGIGEHEKISQQNLLKVPLMIAYFKWAEINPLILRRTLTFTGTGEDGESDRSRSVTKLEMGKSYSINDLVYRMIAQNDAAAFNLLQKNLPQGRLDKIFKDLNVEYDPQKREDSLSLIAVAAFYRVLFNASYLTEETSEKALRYLSKSVFRDGMAAGIPPNISTASKHGERSTLYRSDSDDEDKELIQLHEIGIIYHPNRPFLMGIMARGDDFNHLVKIIREITHLIYDEVDQQSQSPA